MKIALTGKDGQVGRELVGVLQGIGQLTAWNRHDVDLGDGAGLRAALQACAPDIIVNAAAYTAVDAAESDRDTAYQINADAVALMAAHAAQSGALLAHYSTDYVFDGEKADAYLENDAAHPVNVYGASKYAGEQAIIRSGCAALIFRTSWVFSPHGKNFIKTILRLGKERDHLDVVADQYGAPTSASLIARITAQAIMRHRDKTLPGGLYHVTAAGQTTWHALAVRIVERARSNGVALRLLPERIRPLTTEDYPTPARRPKNSRLNHDALANALQIRFPAWEQDVDDVIDQLCRQQEQTP